MPQDKEPDTANGTKMVDWIKWKMEQNRFTYRQIEPIVNPEDEEEEGERWDGLS